jgi:uncharacterized protein DUF4136
MTRRRMATRYAVAALAALTLAGCASMNVRSFVERGVDFGFYQTYDWGPAGALTTGDPRLDNNPFFHDYVHRAFETQLAARGFEKTPDGTPDLLLHYHASIVQKLDVERAEGGCADCRPEVYDAGTLLIDFIDARTKKLVWRGWAEGSIEGVIDNQAWMEARIDEAVARILEKLPRAPHLARLALYRPFPDE